MVSSQRGLREIGGTAGNGEPNVDPATQGVEAASSVLGRSAMMIGDLAERVPDRAAGRQAAVPMRTPELTIGVAGRRERRCGSP
jgi:hypothetical protein